MVRPNLNLHNFFYRLKIENLFSNLLKFRICCDVAVTQINYPNLNKQDSIEQIRGWSHKENLVQVFIQDDLELGVLRLFRLCYGKQNKTIKLNEINLKLIKRKTLVSSKRPLSEIKIDHWNNMSNYILNIYLFLTLVN